MTQKNNVLILLLVLLTSLGNVQSFAGRKGRYKSEKAKTHKVHHIKEAPQDDGEYYNGHKIITGPRGGRYYINGNGNKTYIRK